MTEIQWSEKLSVMIDEIDDQHKKIYNMINQLSEDYQRHIEPERLQLELVEMIIFICTHFQTEEGYMRRLDYPEYQSHKDQHSELISRLINELKTFDDHPVESAGNILELLSSWLIDDHIWIADGKFGGFIAKNYSRADNIRPMVSARRREHGGS